MSERGVLYLEQRAVSRYYYLLFPQYIGREDLRFEVWCSCPPVREGVRKDELDP